LQVDALQSSVTDVTNALKDILYGLIDVSKLVNSKFKIEIDISNHDPNGPNAFPLKIVDKKSKEIVKIIDCCKARYISKAKSSCSATVGLFDNFTKPITVITTNKKKQSKNNKKVESKANTVEMEIDKKDDEEEDNNQNPKTKKQKQMKRAISKKKEEKISEPNIVEKEDARQQEKVDTDDDLSVIFNNEMFEEEFEIIERDEVDNQNSTGINK